MHFALCHNEKMDLSIVIPMFNEAENVEATLDQVEEALASFQGTYEIIAVNDGSLDNTLEILNRVASTRWKGKDCFLFKEYRPGNGLKERI